MPCTKFLPTFVDALMELSWRFVHVYRYVGICERCTYSDDVRFQNERKYIRMRFIAYMRDKQKCSVLHVVPVIVNNFLSLNNNGHLAIF